MGNYEKYFEGKTDIEISGEFLNACKNLNLDKIDFIIKSKKDQVNKFSINEGLLDIARSVESNKQSKKLMCAENIIENIDIKMIDNYFNKIQQSIAFDNDNLGKYFLSKFHTILTDDEKIEIYIGTLEIKNIGMLMFFNECCVENHIEQIKSKLFKNLEENYSTQNIENFETFFLYGYYFLNSQELEKMRNYKELEPLSRKIELYKKLTEQSAKIEKVVKEIKTKI